MITAPRPAGHGKDQDVFGPVHERGGLGEVRGRRAGAQREAFSVRIGEFQDPAGSPGDLGDGLVAEVVDQLIQGRRHRR